MRPDLRPYLGQTVTVVVDRPLGSRHPRHPDLWYPVNYGYLPGTTGGDGAPIDAYLLGVYTPVAQAEGTVLAVVARADDAEDKLVVAPPGCAYSADQIAALIAFQERFFTSRVVVAPGSVAPVRLLGAVHVFLRRAEQVLLLRRYQTGYEDGNYSVPAGHLDGGETVVAAARREVAEEVGVRIAPADLAVVGVMHRRGAAERIDFFLAAHRWTGTIANREPHKCDELRWAALDALPPTVIPYVRHALAAYRAGRWFSSFGWDDE
jgi:ADP-ribose pyrophosphatase YjhB (NUDIX family)